VGRKIIDRVDDYRLQRIGKAQSITRWSRKYRDHAEKRCLQPVQRVATLGLQDYIGAQVGIIQELESQAISLKQSWYTHMTDLL
jgi:hypothetical protein